MGKRGLRGTTKRHWVQLLPLVGALAAMGVWTNLSGYGAVFLEPSRTNASFEAMRYAYYGGGIAASITFIAAPRILAQGRRALGLCIPLLVGFGTICYALAYNQTLLNPLLLGGVASLALGFCYLWTVATLYIAVARIASAREAVLVILAAQIAEQLLSVIATHTLPPSIQIVLCFLCPLAALGALVRALPLRHEREAETSPWASHLFESEPYEHRALFHTYLLQSASGIAIVAMGAASSVGSWGRLRPLLASDDFAPTLLCSSLSCLLLTGLVVAFLLPMIGRPLSYRYQTAFLTIAASITLAILQPSLDPSWSNAFDIVQSAVEFFSHVLLWVILIMAIKETGGNPYLLAGISLAPYSLLSLVWIIMLEINASALSFALVFVSYLLILIVAVHPRRLYERDLPHLTSAQDLNEYTLDGEPVIPPESNGATVVQLIERRCLFVGQMHGLSARETQVLSLLAQGRSRPAIQRQLVLSEGTVKTHISHIYEKMGVGSLQEAIDLVYEEAASVHSRRS